jgi:hypothetical protein
MLLLKRALMGLAILIALPYLRPPVYDFPAPRPFSGSAFVNPYANLQGTWQRANLHAHGRAWGGLSNGRQSSLDVVRKYRSMGYAVPGISNYQQIAAHHGVPTIPLYEHGYNIYKHHQLAIGAHRVTWFDLLLWQSRSHQQFIINQVASTADLVALAHPPSRDAYSSEDLSQLTGYHLLEIVNGPFRSEEPWDAALSSGHPVWALGNDDSHDITNPRRTGGAWTMIDAASPDTADIVGALRAGRAYTVMRTNESASVVDTSLSGVEFADGTLSVTCAGDPSTFIFIGQDGAVRRTVKNALHAEYTFEPRDTYIRTVIRSPRTSMYLNPVFRYDGRTVPAPVATIDTASTWVMRLGLAGAGALLIAVARARRRGVSLRTATAPLPRAGRGAA